MSHRPRAALLVLSLLFLPAYLAAEPPTKQAQHQTSDESHPQALAAEKAYGGHIELPVDSQVIRDQSSYDAFVEHIPDRKIVKRAEPPPNDDPLLDKPAIDFDEKMLVAATCPTYYCAIEFVGIRQDDEGHTIVVNLAGEGKYAKYAARPAGIGNYRARLVPTVDGPVEFEFRGPGKRTRETESETLD